jgi:hypothetical protein
VKSIEEASKGMKVLLEPFVVSDFVRVGFYQYEDSTVLEFMEYLRDEGEWFPEEG